MSTLAIIKAEIKTMLTGLIATTNIQVVYDEPPTILETTPACTVLRSGRGKLEYANTGDMKLRSNYKIRVFLEKIKDDSGQVEVMDDILDHIITAIATRETQLSDNVCRLEITDISELKGANVGNSAIMYSDITLETYTFKPLD